MPGKLSDNEHGKKAAGTEARLLFACPIQGRNEWMIADSAIKPISITYSRLSPLEPIYIRAFD
jgi:hypothetical protein